MGTLGIDIGGSSVKYAIVDYHAGSLALAQPLRTSVLPSRHFDDLRKTELDLVKGYGSEVDAIGISTTGAVGRDGIVANAGHFEGYRSINWEAELSRAGIGVPVRTINDGKAVALAEYSQHEPCKSFMSVVVGTGVGAGLIIDGRLVYGDDEWAGGLGHMKVPASVSDVVCSCGRTGCVETSASGPAVVESFGDGSVSFKDIAERASEGNRVALAALEQAGGALGEAIGNIMNLLNPRVVTIGGGVIDGTRGVLLKEGCYFAAAARRAFEVSYGALASRTLIVPSELGNAAGVIGAVVHVLEH